MLQIDIQRHDYSEQISQNSKKQDMYEKRKQKKIKSFVGLFHENESMMSVMSLLLIDN
jgi:hypothetical protein